MFVAALSQWSHPLEGKSELDTDRVAQNTRKYDVLVVVQIYMEKLVNVNIEMDETKTGKVGNRPTKDRKINKKLGKLDRQR